MRTAKWTKGFPMNDRMSNSQQLPHLVPKIALCLFLGCPLLPRPTYGQAPQSQSDQLATSIARVKSGEADGWDVEVIAHAKAVQAVPALEEQFRRATDVDFRSKIANALVRLGDKDDTYWNYLLEQATLAVDSDVPDSIFSDSQGKLMMKESTPELQAWAHTHNVSPETAREYATYDLPGKVWDLAQTGDARGIPLLRRALQSRNCPMASTAAKGLAQIQDKESIPLIIAASQRAAGGCGGAIALALIYFDDPQAQSAVDTYVPKETAKASRDARANGLGPFGYDH
jgi:HEAT repeat protein